MARVRRPYASRRPRYRGTMRRSYRRTSSTSSGYRRKGRRNLFPKRYKARISRFRAPLGNFPSTKTVALRYVETVAFDAVPDISIVNVFRVNNIFDPNYTGVGHQPMYRDNYATLYSRYRVNYATITMVALSTHAVNVATPNLVAGTNIGDNQYYNQNQRACRMFIVRDKTPTDYSSDIDTLIEEGNRDMVWRYCPQTTTAGMPTLRMQCWPHRLLNTDRKDSSLQADIAGGPANEAYFICGVADLGSGNPDNMSFQFIITYNVTFTDLLKNQNQN